MPNYNRIIKKDEKKKRRKKIYVSANILNEIGFLAKSLKKDLEKLDKHDKEIIELLETLKTDEIIEYYNWGLDSNNTIIIYICPIMEGTKPQLLNYHLQIIAGSTHVKNEMF